MKLEKFIKNISSFLAVVVLFFLVGGMYLSSKGFVMNEDGSIVLIPSAYAKNENADIPKGYVFPDKHSSGTKDAAVSLYEFSSFKCPHCADFHLKTLPLLKQKYANDNKLRIVFVPFPLEKTSMDIALLAECIDKDKYMEFISLVFEKQKEWQYSKKPMEVIKQYAALSGLPQEKANACMHNDEMAEEILTNRQNAITQLGIQGTPSFIISKNGEDEFIGGALSFEEMSLIIDKKLQDQK